MSLIKIWKNKGKIAEGIMNSIFKSEHVEEIAAERMKICMECPSIDHEGKKCAVPGTQPCCGACGCSLHLKQRSLSSFCDEGRWDAVVTEEEEDAIKEQINNK
jgi:hypothetical protein